MALSFRLYLILIGQNIFEIQFESGNLFLKNFHIFLENQGTVYCYFTQVNYFDMIKVMFLFALKSWIDLSQIFQFFLKVIIM